MRIVMAQSVQHMYSGNGVIRSLTAFGHKVSNNMEFIKKDGLSFGLILQFLLGGLAIRRKSWSGNKFLYYVPAASYPAMTRIAKKFADEKGNVGYKAYIAIKCKDGDVGFYTPTQCDVLAEDWEVLE